MKFEHLSQMETFSLRTLPDLDEVVLAALELFIRDGVPKLSLGKVKRPLVVGSGNAAVTGKIIFADTDAVFADEGTYLDKIKLVDSAFLLSASGSKHAVTIAKELKKRKIPTTLVTNVANAPASSYVKKSIVLAKNREPYTYNTSTYMGMILAKSGEDPKQIYNYINRYIKPKIPSFKRYNSYYLQVPPKFDANRELFVTKFDELFGSVINGRVFTTEQTKHAKTVVPSKTECFLSFGVDNKSFGSVRNRVNFPLPSWAGPATCMAVVYYVIGHMQKQNPAYFKKHIAAYCRDASKIFGMDLKPIVE